MKYLRVGVFRANVVSVVMTVVMTVAMTKEEEEEEFGFGEQEFNNSTFKQPRQPCDHLECNHCLSFSHYASLY